MLKELKAHHRNIIQMSFNGYSAGEISERIGVSTITVSQVINSPMGKAYLNGLSDRATEATIDVRKELISMNKEALKTLNRLLDPKQKAPASVQLGAAKDVLDRSGFKAPDKINLDMTFQNKSDAEIDAEIAALEGSINKTQYVQEKLPDDFKSEYEDDTIPEDEAELDDDSEPDVDFPEGIESEPEIDPEVEETLNNAEFDPFGNIKE